MLWRLTLALAVVCNCVKADVMSRLILPRDYGVKLCGREFIRAVIFTCGGSRWKRSAEGDLDPYQWSSLSEVTEQDNQQVWRRAADLTDGRSSLHVASSHSLSDLLALYRAAGDVQQPSVSDPTGDSQQSAVLGEREGGAPDWLVGSRKKRNFSLGVAGMCCSQGCTKNDIGRLC
ncbi:prorelaxin H1 [Stegastes partitus]|uniref:Relaxin-3-like n=1 Tax=Stegastes partitus TaxID=144197 RepID=A0A3B4ZH70_9TELE|nr:PREDICTED: relaxin-3-like [Stegastes partitus]